MSKSPTIHDLYKSHTGKGSDKWTSYLDAYEYLLRDRKESIESVLEIGVQNGGSLEIWAKYFPEAKNIIGVDINPKVSWLEYDDPRIRALVGDAASEEVAASIKQAYPDGFDLVVDDGSHHSRDIVRSFALLFDQVKVGGVYAAEDLHCSYWSEWCGGLYDPSSSIHFFKYLVDIINHEHWANSAKRTEILKPLAELYGIEFREELVAQIIRVEFVNSICFVHKGDAADALMEPRIFAGQTENVMPVKHLAEISYAPPSQEENEWSAASASVENTLSELRYRSEELEKLRKELALSKEREAELTKRFERRLTEKNKSLDAHREEGLRKLRESEIQIELHEASIARLNAENGALKHLLEAFRRSLSWKITSPARSMATPVLATAKFTRNIASLFGRYSLADAFRLSGEVYRQGGLKAVTAAIQQTQPSHEIDSNGLSAPLPGAYENWIHLNDPLDMDTLTQLAVQVELLPYQPLISVVMPVFNPPIEYLRLAVESLQSQIYTHWELCIADDASPDERVRLYLSELARSDARIKVTFREKNGHISAASNSALTLASGDYIALLDNDDMLTPHALAHVVKAVNANPDAEIIYSDEDKIDEAGNRYGPYFKCDFNYELFLAQNMICHLGVYKHSTLKKIGGFREGVEGAQDWDLALRMIEATSPDKVVHIPRVLYHWRAFAGSTALSMDQKSYAVASQVRSVQEHLDRLGKTSAVEPAPGAPGMLRVRYEFAETKHRVSIIIPTRDRADLLKMCIDSIESRTTHQDYEILVVDNGSTEPETHAYFKRIASERIRIIPADIPFNYPALNNIAAREATGDLICLMNNDIEILSPDWIQEMGSFAIQEEVGCVGAKLWYPDGTLQHGGVVLGIGGIAGHAFKSFRKTDVGYVCRAIVHQSYSAVTAACLMVRKSVFDEVGGLDESFVVALNDVDFCLRVRAAGYRNVWTPYAEMNHHESATRGYEDNPEKIARFERERKLLLSRWDQMLKNDPAYSLNLTLDAEDFGVAPRSRVED